MDRTPGSHGSSLSTGAQPLSASMAALAGSSAAPGGSAHRRQNSATQHPYMPSLSDEAPASVAIVDVGHGRARARSSAANLLMMSDVRQLAAQALSPLDLTKVAELSTQALTFLAACSAQVVITIALQAVILSANLSPMRQHNSYAFFLIFTAIWSLVCALVGLVRYSVAHLTVFLYSELLILAFAILDVYDIATNKASGGLADAKWIPVAYVALMIVFSVYFAKALSLLYVVYGRIVYGRLAESQEASTLFSNFDHAAVTSVLLCVMNAILLIIMLAFYVHRGQPELPLFFVLLFANFIMTAIVWFTSFRRRVLICYAVVISLEVAGDLALLAVLNGGYCSFCDSNDLLMLTFLSAVNIITALFTLIFVTRMIFTPVPITESELDLAALSSKPSERRSSAPVTKFGDAARKPSGSTAMNRLSTQTAVSAPLTAESRAASRRDTGEQRFMASDFLFHRVRSHRARSQSSISLTENGRLAMDRELARPATSVGSQRLIGGIGTLDDAHAALKLSQLPPLLTRSSSGPSSTSPISPTAKFDWGAVGDDAPASKSPPLSAAEANKAQAPAAPRRQGGAGTTNASAATEVQTTNPTVIRKVRVPALRQRPSPTLLRPADVTPTRRSSDNNISPRSSVAIDVDTAQVLEAAAGPASGDDRVLSSSLPSAAESPRLERKSLGSTSAFHDSSRRESEENRDIPTRLGTYRSTLM